MKKRQDGETGMHNQDSFSQKHQTTYPGDPATPARSGFSIARQFAHYSLRTKLIITFLVVSALSIGVVAFITHEIVRSQLLRDVGIELKYTVHTNAERIDDVLAKQLELMQTFGMNVAMDDQVEAVSDAYTGTPAAIKAEIENLDRQWRAAAAAGNNADPLVAARLNNDIVEELNEFRKVFPDHAELMVTDKYGALAGATRRPPAYNVAGEEWWQMAYNNGRGGHYIGQPELDEMTQEIVVAMAVPLFDHDRNVVGIFHSLYRMREITEILNEFGTRGGADIWVAGNMILREENDLIPLPEAHLAELRKNAGVNYSEFFYDDNYSLVSQELIASFNHEEAAAIDRLGWILILDEDPARVLAPMNTMTWTILLTGLGGLILAGLTASFMAQLLTRPIIHLTNVARQISAGDTSVQAQVESGEEIGVLATAFNTMVSQLRRRLEEELALQTAITTISSTLDLNIVLDHIAEQMGRLANVTSAYICSYDAKTNTSTVLAEYLRPPVIDQKETSDLGVTYRLPRLFTRNFQDLLAGQPELVHLHYSGLDEAQKDDRRQLGVQTILNIPLQIRNQIIGFTELWESRQKRLFTVEELALFQSLAQQAAVALDNAYLYDQAMKEIAERQEVEKELRESETKFRILAETTAAGIFIYQQPRIRYVNPATETITGYTKADLLAMDFGEVMHPDFRELIKEQSSARLNGEAIPPQYELKILTKKHEERWLDVTLGLIRFEGELAILATAFDITNRKQAEESLQKSAANLRAIFDSSRQAFILMDRNYQVQAFNKIADRGIKLTSGKALKEGSSIQEYTSIHNPDEFNGDFSQVLQGKLVSLEKNFLVNEKEIWLEYNYNPVLADDGQVIGVCFSSFDITERKELIETLAEKEKRLLVEIQGIFDITQALVSEINLNSLLEVVINQAKYLLNADGAAVLFLSADGQYLEVATPDESWPLIRPGSRLLFDGSLAEQAIVTRQTQTSHYVLGDSRAASMVALLESAQVSSLMCAPLLIQDKNLGVLVIWSKYEQVFDAQDSRLMNLFTNQAALALDNAHLHARNRQLAVEQERQRLARDLHDSVTQSLYSIGMAAETVLRLIGRKTESDIRGPVSHIRQLSQIALKEIREQLHNLHPTTLANKTLRELLEANCNLLHEQYALVVELAADPDLKLSLYQRVNLYYLAKEALWNVVKHAPGAQVHVSITQAANLATLSIVDNGPGFVVAAAAEMEGYGLRSMRERATLMEGSFQLDSRPGEGTRITVQIPLNQKQF